jgi:hypothetical protein
MLWLAPSKVNDLQTVVRDITHINLYGNSKKKTFKEWRKF